MKKGLSFWRVVFLVFLLSPADAETCGTGCVGIDIGETAVIDCEWEFYWGEFILPGNFTGRRPDAIVAIPHRWTDTYPDLPEISRYGIATYRIVVRTGSSGLLMGIRLRKIYSAYELYVNGEKITAAGSIGGDLKDVKSQLAVRTAYFFAPDESFEIVFHVANAFYHRAGIIGPIEIGTAGIIQARRLRLLAGDLLVIAALAIFSVYHFVFFLLNRRDFSSLFFSFFCLIVCIRSALITGERLLYDLISGLPLTADVFIQKFTIFLLVPFFLLFIRIIFPAEFRGKFLPVLVSISGIYLVVSLIFHSMYIDIFVLAYYPVLFTGIGYIAAGIIRAIAHKQPDAVLQIIGFSFIIVTTIHDILVDRSLLNAEYILSFGLLGYISVQSIIINRRFARAILKEQELSRELAQMNRFLELRVAERTSELNDKNRELKNEKERAEEALHVKSRFLSGMSHEMRTPLTGIMGYSEIIKKEADRKSAEYADKILVESQKLLRFIEQALDLSNINNGKNAGDAESFRLRNVLEEICREFSETGGNEKAEMTLGISSLLPECMTGDVRTLTEVIRSIIKSAAARSARGRIHLYADLLEVNQNTVKICIFIHCTGSRPASVNPTPETLGISKWLSRLSGSVSCTGSIDGGSTYSIILELKVEECTEEKTEKNDAVIRFEAKSVLLIEDSRVTQEIIAEHLKAAGLTVHVAENGAEGLKVLERESIDLVLMDVQMPVMNGLETTSRIRSGYKKPDIPIIGITANAFYDDKLRCISAGMNSVLTKPLRRNLLMKELARYLVPMSVGRTKPGVLPREPADPVFDIAELRREFSDNSEVISDLLGGFLSEIAAGLNSISTLLPKGDTYKVHQIIHAIKGGAMNMMAQRLAHTASIMESAAKQGQISDAEVIFEHVREEFSILRERILILFPGLRLVTGTARENGAEP